MTGIRYSFARCAQRFLHILLNLLMVFAVDDEMIKGFAILC